MAPARYWSSCVIILPRERRYVHFSGTLTNKNTKEKPGTTTLRALAGGANEVTWRVYGKQRKRQDKWNLIAVGTTWCSWRWPNKQSSGTLFLNWPSGHHTTPTRRASEHHLWVIVPFKSSWSDVHQPKGDVPLLSINVVLYLLFFLRLNCG